MSKETKKFIRRNAGFICMRLLAKISGLLSIGINYRAGAFLAKIWFMVASRHRKTACKSLHVAYPELSEAERISLARSSFVSMAQSFFEMMHTLRNLDSLDAVAIEGTEHVDEALKRGKGVIGVTAHLGNFPLISLKLACLGYPVNIMARPMRDEKIGEYLHQMRMRAEVKTIWSLPRRASVHETIRRLRDNDIVLIPMDQNFGSGGVWVKFFGKLAATPVGPLIFAQRTGAALLPMYVLRESIGRHRIRIMPMIQCIQREDKDEMILENTIQITKMIEGWIRTDPAQWGWIHRRWKSDPPPKIQEARFKIQKD